MQRTKDVLQRTIRKNTLAQILAHRGAGTQTQNNPEETEARTRSNSNETIDEIYELILSKRRNIIDEQNGINSTIITFGNNNKKAWLREIATDDLNNSDLLKNESITHNYLRIFYAYLIAALTISKIYQLDDTEFVQQIHDLKRVSTKAFHAILQTPDYSNEDILRFLGEAKGKLIDLLRIRGQHKYGEINFLSLLQQENNSHDNANFLLNRMLDQTRSWIALEKPSLPIITRIKTGEPLGNQSIIIVDEPCSELTAAQKAQFENLDAQAWFIELSPFHKNLVRYYQQHILADDRVVPSQLRGTVPAGKNTYKESVYSQENDGSLVLLNESLHTGTVAHLSHKSPDVALAVTRKNLLQQKAHCGTDATVMICLNSSLGDWVLGAIEWVRRNKYVADDSQIINLTYQAAQSLRGENIYFAKICINGFRKYEFNDYGGVNDLLKIMETNLRMLNDEHSSEVKKLRGLINRIYCLEKYYTDNDVKGLDIIYYLTKAALTNNQLAEKTQTSSPPAYKFKTISVCFGCASGENRTGITYINNIYQTIIDYYEQEKKLMMNDLFRKKIYALIIKSQHFFVVTGNQGGTFCAEGLRIKSIDACKQNAPKTYLASQFADLKTITALDANFDCALSKLKKAIADHQDDRLVKPMLPWALRIVKRAEINRSKVKLMTNDESEAYVSALEASAEVINQPLNDQAFHRLSNAALRVNEMEQFKGTYHHSWGLAIGGILLGLAGASLAVIAISAALASFGISTPLSAASFIIGSTLIAKAAAISSATIGTGAFFGGGLIAKHGFFNYEKGVADSVMGLQKRHCSLR